MTSIKLKFKKVSNVDKEGSLYFQIIHNRVVKQVKTNYRIHENEWDKTNECIVETLTSDENRNRELAIIRDKVQWKYRKLENIIEAFKLRCEPYSVDNIVGIYEDKLSKEITVFEFFDRQIVRLNKLGKSRTAECYKSCIKSFMKFRNGIDLFFDMLDSEMIELYEAYLKQNNLCRNTTSFYLRNLRSIYNKAIKAGIASNPSIFENVYTGIDKTAKRAISLQEIKKIKHIDLSGNKILEFVRDIFMFSFYTRGMSFVDIAFLRKKDVSNGYLAYSRKKTGQQLVIKWKDEMREIVDRYYNADTQYLLPIIDAEDGTERQQYLNKMTMVNRKLKLLMKKVDILTPLTMYVARHSWASIARDNHVPTSIISKGMGHNSETTTEIYLSSIQNNWVDDANDKILSAL